MVGIFTQGSWVFPYDPPFGAESPLLHIYQHTPGKGVKHELKGFLDKEGIIAEGKADYLDSALGQLENRAVGAFEVFS